MLVKRPDMDAIHGAWRDGYYARAGHDAIRLHKNGTLAQRTASDPLTGMSSDVGAHRPSAVGLYILASVLGTVLFFAALVFGFGAGIALKAYVLPCAIALSLHLGLAAIRLTGLTRPRN
ncbi:hypothetical protein O4H61_14960 [Roseovarius aestuarii]|nr:hypothetical protein [Roseovarius aestuarii]